MNFKYKVTKIAHTKFTVIGNDVLVNKIYFSNFSSSDREVLARDARRVRDLGITTFAVGVKGALVPELRVRNCAKV